MALSATFTANFSSFYAAVEKADLKLKDFGEGADKVGGRLNKMGDQFSGVKIVQEATLMARAVEEIGGVSKLTEKELARLGATAKEAVEKMKKMGIDVPKNLQDIADKTKTATKATNDWIGPLTKVASAMGIAFSVDAVKDFIRSVFAAASAVKDLSDQWGVSTKAVQQWSAAAKASGVESETVGKSLQFLTANLAEGSTAYKALLANVGLSYDKLRQMPLEEAYKQVISAIGGITDETLQLDVALGLTGVSSKKMIGAIRDGFLEAADAQKYMSDETIKRLEAAEAAWEKFGNNVKIITGEFLGDFMRRSEVAFSSWGNYLTYLKKGLTDTFITGGNSAGEWVREMEEAAKRAQAKPATPLAPMASHGPRVKTQAELAKEQRDNDKAEAQSLAARTKALAEFQREEERYAAWKLEMITGISAAEKQLAKDEQRLIKEGFLLFKIPPMSKSWAEILRLGELAAATLKIKQSLGIIKPTDWNELFKNAIPAEQLWGGVRERAMALGDVEKLRKSFGAVSTAIAVVGGAAQGAFGKVIRYVEQAAGMVFEYILATKAADAATKALATTAAAANIAMAGLTLGFSLAFSSIMSNQAAAAESAKAWRDQVYQLNQEFGLTTEEFDRIFALHKGSIGPGLLRQIFTQAQEAIGGLRDLTSAFGGVLPQSVRPMVDEILRMQNLPQGLRDQLGAFAEAPAWQTIQKRAQDLGIELGALGGGFNQARIADMGFGFFHDLEMFLDQGADLDSVLRGMSDELSALAVDAMKTGAALPKSLEPFMKRLQEMGLLVDENGNAIDDLSFKDLEDESLKAVVAVLEQIRELLARALPQAAATLGTAFNTHLPGGSTGAFATVPGERIDTGTAAGGSGATVNVYAIDAPSFETFLKQRGGAEAVVRAIPDVVERWGRAQ